MNEYLIEWLNMKIDEALQKADYESYDILMQLKEIVEGWGNNAERL